MTCLDGYELGRRDVIKYTSRLAGWLRAFGLLKTPLPPFKIGDKVRYTHELDGVYSCHHGQTYTVRSLYVAENKKKWFVRLDEVPSSAPAEFFHIA